MKIAVRKPKWNVFCLFYYANYLCPDYLIYYVSAILKRFFVDCKTFTHTQFAQRFILDTFWGVHVLQELCAVSLLLSCFNLIVLTAFINCWVTHILCLFIFNVIQNYHFILSPNKQTMHAYFKFPWKNYQTLSYKTEKI